jgi:hypothetical protein
MQPALIIWNGVWRDEAVEVVTAAAAPERGDDFVEVGVELVPDDVPLFGAWAGSSPKRRLRPPAAPLPDASSRNDRCGRRRGGHDRSLRRKVSRL